MPTTDSTEVAYFSMEIALHPSIPTYSGGLGVLAGDTLRSAADLGVDLVAVTLLYRKGYFRQTIDGAGNQHESPVDWRPEEHMEPLDVRVSIDIEGREVKVRPWRYTVRGVTGHQVVVYLLDTALPENSDWDRGITDSLYGGDSHYRLCQETVLGVAGVASLQALGHTGLVVYHMNEGHAALLTLALLERQLAGRGSWAMNDLDVTAVRQQCVFTTHTPVPAGHDRFSLDLARRVLGQERVTLLEKAHVAAGNELNMTHLALRFSRYCNAVARRHQEVSREMFPEYPIASITNGVHAATWTSEPMRALFDHYVPEWRVDNLYLRQAVRIPHEELRAAHTRAKDMLLEEVARRTGHTLERGVMTIGFARRAATYKRADLVFSDLDRLRKVVRRAGPLQILYGGKAHPNDELGKALIRRIHEAARALGGDLRVVYLENYEMPLGHLLTAGVDLWLNTPMRPLEASGTSGMKAALNGVPSLSVLDGWWVEGHVEGVTGWAIGEDDELPVDPSADIGDLYFKLEREVLPLYYGRPYAYAEVMRQAIAVNGSYFNTQRMVAQYIRNAYFPANGNPVIERRAEPVGG
ncbi:MAG: alpha-glucan family phosphorylase [Gemmatimonadaceae bacterium]